MNTTSRTITGILGALLGIFIIGVAIRVSLVFLIYGGPILIISLFVYFNKKEDDIEEIKERKDL